VKNRTRKLIWWSTVIGISLWLVLGLASSLAKTPNASALFISPLGVPSLTPTPFFRFPVVSNAPISGYFDHKGSYRESNQLVTFFDGRHSDSGNGFWFTCPSPVGDDWVGCEVAASSEIACPDNKELWYDAHYGTDFEYVADWRTGSSCNLGKFQGITRPVYAPAPGKVDYVGFNDPYNGNYIRLVHDLNKDGNYDNDGLRSYYLHFADGGISSSIVRGAYVSEGQYLGLGGMTGKASTPHMHFEVQRLISGQWFPVDPFSWTGADNDPWPYANYNYPLWHYYNYIPATYPRCSRTIAHTAKSWSMATLIQVIRLVGSPVVPTAPIQLSSLMGEQSLVQC